MAHVRRHVLAAAQYKKDRKPVFLLGHSLGGNEVSDVAHCLKAKGVPVAFVFYYEPTPFVSCVPVNVSHVMGALVRARPRRRVIKLRIIGGEMSMAA